MSPKLYSHTWCQNKAYSHSFLYFFIVFVHGKHRPDMPSIPIVYRNGRCTEGQEVGLFFFNVKKCILSMQFHV